jgi:hypothetical protein
MERCVASVMRAVSGEVVAITSSSCMMMSEPMEFWREMECSGVRSLGGRDVRLDFLVLKASGREYDGMMERTWAFCRVGSGIGRLLL